MITGPQSIVKARENIKLAEGVRYTKLLKPFFPKTYERIMAKKANEVLLQKDSFRAMQPVERKDATAAAVRKMEAVPVKPKYPLGANILWAIPGAIVFANFVNQFYTLSAKVSAAQKDFQSWVFGSATAVAIALVFNYIDKLKNPDRQRIGNELVKAIHSAVE